MVIFIQISSSTTSVIKNLKILAKRANIDKRISFYTSRHTWATLALKKNMSIAHVSKIMAHSDIKTTMVYTKIVNNDLDDAMEIFN